MNTLFIAKDGTQFNSRIDCLNYELENQLTYKCPACEGLGYKWEDKFVSVKEEIWDFWVGSTTVDTKKVVSVQVPCYYCQGEGYIDKPLVPKYKIHKELLGYENI